jgi:uncharacterized spore protein YtfJ
VDEGSQQVVDRIAERVSRAITPLADISAARIFGTPVEYADRVVIPVAAFEVGAGFGFGGGGDETHGNGGGGGGGGYTQGRPVAMIEITNNGVRVIPVLDWTRVGITALGTALAVWRITRRH